MGYVACLKFTLTKWLRGFSIKKMWNNLTFDAFPSNVKEQSRWLSSVCISHILCHWICLMIKRKISLLQTLLERPARRKRCCTSSSQDCTLPFQSTSLQTILWRRPVTWSVISTVSYLACSSYKYIHRSLFHRFQWGHNLELLNDRVLKHPERVRNLYFTFLFVLRAVTKVSSFIRIIYTWKL